MADTSTGTRATVELIRKELAGSAVSITNWEEYLDADLKAAKFSEEPGINLYDSSAFLRWSKASRFRGLPSFDRLRWID
jgi:hypothetical protein